MDRDFVKKRLIKLLKIYREEIPNHPARSTGIINIKIDGWEKVCTLHNESYVIYKRIVKHLLSDKVIGLNFEKKEIDNRVYEVVTEIIKANQEKIDKASIELVADGFIDNLEKEIIDLTVAFPIENLTLASEINLGNVTLFPANKNIKRWKNSACREINTSNLTAKQKHDRKEYLQTLINRTVAEHPYVAVKIRCRAKKSNVLAFNQAEMAINVLRFFEYHYGLQKIDATCFGIIPIPQRQVQASLVLPNDASWLSAGFKVKGPLIEQTFQEKNLKKLKRSLEFKRLKNFIQKPTTDMDKRLKSAIMWYGEARIEQIQSVKFLKYIVAIEILLTHKNDQHEGRISANIKERFAFLLTKRKDVVKRKYLLSVMDELYNERSKIVHRGTRELSEYHVKTAQLYSHATIHELLIKSSINSAEELAKWVNERKLA